MYRNVRRIADTVMVTDLSKHLEFTGRLRTITATGKGEEALNDHDLLLQIAIKSSDVGHCSKALPLHLKWTDLIIKRCFDKGTKSGSAEIKSPHFVTVGLLTPRNQVGFFQFVTLWCEHFELTVVSEDHVAEANHQYWIEMRDKANSGLGMPSKEKTRSKSVITFTVDSSEIPAASSEESNAPGRKKGCRGAVVIPLPS